MGKHTVFKLDSVYLERERETEERDKHCPQCLTVDSQPQAKMQAI